MGAINKSWNTSNEQVEREYHNTKQKSKQKKMFMRASILLITGLIVSGFMYSNVRQQQSEVQKVKEERIKLENQYKQLAKENRFLEKEIEKLNDDEYILKIARRDFFFSKQGEIIFPVESHD